MKATETMALKLGPDSPLLYMVICYLEPLNLGPVLQQIKSVHNWHFGGMTFFAGGRTIMDNPQTFDEAVARFREYLRGLGVLGELIWIEPEDLLLTGSPQYYVRLSGVEREKQTAGSSAPRLRRSGRNDKFLGNEARARAVFVSRTGTDTGVGFRVVAFAPGGLCCCAVKRTVPGVKFSVPIEESRVEAVGVRSRFRWWLLRWKYRDEQEMRGSLFEEW